VTGTGSPAARCRPDCGASRRGIRAIHERQLPDVDDRPYGGGPGMVMLAEPLDRALEAARQDGGNGKTIYLSPQGSRLDHRKVIGLAKKAR